MSAGVLNITIEQGSTFHKQIRFLDETGALRDLSDVTYVRAKIIPAKGISSSIAVGDDSYGATEELSLRVQGIMPIQLCLHVPSAVLSIDILATDTDDLSFDHAWWEVDFVFSDNGVERMLEGVANLSRWVFA